LSSRNFDVVSNPTPKGGVKMPASFAPGEAYAYPLIIKKLLNTPMIYAPDQQIVYRDRLRISYRDLDSRIHRLANGLASLGIQSGDTVAVLDYDSHRYLECFFAIPMMGAVLQTVNWRLSADQIAYTLNHAEAKLVMINSDFLPLLDTVRQHLKTVQTFVLISEDGGASDYGAQFAGEYEQMLTAAAPQYAFADLDENTKATTFYTTGTTGDPKGVYFSHRQLVLHTLAVSIAVGSFEMSICR
jgi:fatty-acyl-CoA synthase